MASRICTGEHQASQLKIAARRQWCARVLDETEANTPARKALMAEMMAACGLSKSYAYDLVKRFDARPETALVRTPRSDKGQSRVLTPDDRDLFLQFCCQKERVSWPAAQKIRRFREWLQEHHGRELECSNPTLTRLLGDTDKALGMTRRERRAAFQRQLRMKADYANEVWQWDQHTADLFVVDEKTGEVYRPILIAIVDRHSQAFMGGGYFKGYDTDGVEATLIDAIYPSADMPFCGTPLMLHGDNGKQFVSQFVRQVMRALGIVKDVGPLDERVDNHIKGIPCEPHGHGFIEQHHNMVKQFESEQPRFAGSVDKERPLIERAVRQRERAPEAPLTLDELNRRFRQYVSRDLLHRPFRGSVSRATLWQQSILEHPERSAVPDPLQLAEAMKHKKLVHVRDGMFRFQGLDYTAPGLGNWNGLEVEIRYLTRDLRQVWVCPGSSVVFMASVLEKHGYRTELSQKDLKARGREWSATKVGIEQLERILEAAGGEGHVAVERARQAVATLRDVSALQTSDGRDLVEAAKAAPAAGLAEVVAMPQRPALKSIEPELPTQEQIEAYAPAAKPRELEAVAAMEDFI